MASYAGEQEMFEALILPRLQNGPKRVDELGLTVNQARRGLEALRQAGQVYPKTVTFETTTGGKLAVRYWWLGAPRATALRI